MKPLVQGSLLVHGLGLASSSVAGLFFEEGPSPVIYPDQKLPLNFDHSFHTRKSNKETGVEGAGLSCTFCHENIDESKTTADHNIPGHETCENCHEDWIGEEGEELPPAEACARCHTGYQRTATSSAVAKLSIPAAHLKFSHERHLGAGELECSNCHVNVKSRALATRNDLPTMDRCIACHQDSKVSTDCTSCHLADKRGLVEDHYASGRLMPRRFHQFALHDAAFLKDHSNAARTQPEFCSSCHTKTECLSCHDGVGRDLRYHPGDWIALHPLKARKDDDRCQSCHTMQNFCLNCHIRTGVAAVGDPGAAGFALSRSSVRQTGNMPSAPHPVGPVWRGDTGSLGANSHGFHAQRNMRSCAACHQEQYCVKCHGSGVIGASGLTPHGPNPQRLKGSTASKRNARACLKCHSPTDPRWR